MRRLVPVQKRQGFVDWAVWRIALLLGAVSKSHRWLLKTHEALADWRIKTLLHQLHCEVCGDAVNRARISQKIQDWKTWASPAAAAKTTAIQLAEEHYKFRPPPRAA